MATKTTRRTLSILNEMPPFPEGWYFVAHREELLRQKLIEKVWMGQEIVPRNEHRHTSAYAPFGVGTHACGGSGWSRIQMAANLLLIARHLELELVPRNYQFKPSPLPKVSPNKKFKFRVAGHRHPLEPAG